MLTIPTINFTKGEIKRLERDFFSDGAEAVIFKTPNPNTLYKIFDYEKEWDPELSYRNKQAKLIQLYNMRELKHSVLPVSLINVDGEFAGYEMTYDQLDRSLLTIELPLEQRIILLSQIKSILEYYASKDITYVDIKSSNILINRRTGKPKFCDIDNIRIGNYWSDTIPVILSDIIDQRCALDHIIDMYMFNLLTLEQLVYPGQNYQEILEKLESGIFPKNLEDKAYPILESMLDPESYEGETIIQYVKK